MLESAKPSGTIDDQNAQQTSNGVAAEGSGTGERNRVLEDLVSQFLAQQPGLELTSITLVKCDMRQCQIVFTGTDANPQGVGAYDELHFGLMRQRWEDYAPLQGSIAVRELAPGAKEFVMGFQYRTYEDLSDDPVLSARQHAACAAVWERDAAREEARGHDEAAARIREIVERELSMATRVLGPIEAGRLAAQMTGSSLHRTCRKQSAQ